MKNTNLHSSLCSSHRKLSHDNFFHKLLFLSFSYHMPLRFLNQPFCIIRMEIFASNFTFLENEKSTHHFGTLHCISLNSMLLRFNYHWCMKRIKLSDFDTFFIILLFFSFINILRYYWKVFNSFLSAYPVPSTILFCIFITSRIIQED
jgi:hypothetical protein